MSETNEAVTQSIQRAKKPVKKLVKKPVKKPAKRNGKLPEFRKVNHEEEKKVYTTPEGFIVARSEDEFFDAVDWEATPHISGVVLSIRIIELKKPKKGEAKTTRVLSFENDDGESYSIWEKKQLEALFNVVEVGTRIDINHVGTVDIPGRALPMHRFKCCYLPVVEKKISAKNKK